jgi:NAD(P)-dependent dehydrogenase (short-subunit alcohol dehydrogenase family)
VAGRLQNKVALITGGASGIGRAAAVRFAKEGAKVMIADRNPALSSETLAQLLEITPHAASVPVDVSKTDQVQRMVDETAARFGGLDILVNAAGVLLLTPPLAEIDERDWDLMMNTNLRGLFLCCKAAIPVIERGGGGAIVNISSMAGISAYARSLPYAVSKAGVIHLTLGAASQYTSRGIRINCIAPGTVDTPQARGSSGSAEALRKITESHPMGRIGRPEDIADTILFLASDEASFVSGATYIVDGGSRHAGRRL